MAHQGAIFRSMNAIIRSGSSMRLHLRNFTGSCLRHFEWYQAIADSLPSISSLNPKRLTPDDHWFPSTDNRTVIFDGIYPQVRLSYRIQRSDDPMPIRFPETAGFLYYRSDPGPLSPVSDSVRFRETPHASLEGFQQGQDLLLPNGLPWQIMAGQIASLNGSGPDVFRYEGLRKKLLAEGLMDEDDLHYIRAVHKDRQLWYPSLTLFSLEQPFEFVFDKNLILTMVGRTGERRFVSRFHGGPVPSWLFSGSVLARFELSRNPSPTDVATVSIRVLKIVDPVRSLVPNDPGPLCVPTEGDFLRVKRASGEPRPWTFALRGDSANVKALMDVGKRFERRTRHGTVHDPI
ncbi:hypothetical protein DFH09DRAFT_1169092 [Mycena vulgaris]|nr:hypothetical protein DFH09DRAFT_1169092 [Mycena vulgaris]